METRVAEVKVVGEVRAVELRDDGGGVFRLRLADGTVVSGEFAADYEEVVTQAFHLHRWNHLGVKGEGEFDEEGALLHIRGAKQCRITEPGEAPDAVASQDSDANVLARMVKMADEVQEKYPAPEEEPAVGIVEMFDELNAKYPVPEEEQPPADFAANYKHYLYGFPKKEETGHSVAGQESVAEAVGQDPAAVGGVNLAEVFAEIREKYPLGKDDIEPPADFAANYKHYLYGFPKEGV